MQSCSAFAQLSGGTATCQFGCLGYGDCVHVCTFDAIHVIDGVAKVDPEKCTACNMCVGQCPKHLINILPLKEQAIVHCSNHNKGAVANKVCKVACIACKKCEKACEFDAIMWWITFRRLTRLNVLLVALA